MSFLSALLGLDASHNAGVAQNAADQAQTEATGYRSQASGLYNGLSQQGQDLEGQGTTQYTGATSLINSLLPQYEGAAGINGANNPGGTSQPGGTAAPSNSFALTPDELQQLNSQVDVINQQHQAAQQANQAAQAQRGFVDPSASEGQNQIIAEHFNQAVNDHTAQFMNTAQQNRLSAINNLLGFGANQQSGGVGQQEAGLGVEGGAASGIAGLGAQAMENSAQQSTNAANLTKQSNASLGNFANLLTQGLGSLFGGGKAATPTIPSTTVPGGDPGIGGANYGPPTPSAPSPIMPSYFLMGSGGSATGGGQGSGDAYDNAMFDASGGF
jgi:hypothetical protein